MTQAGVDGVWGVWKLGCNPRMNSLFFRRIFRRALRSFGDFAIGLFLWGFWLFFLRTRLPAWLTSCLFEPCSRLEPPALANHRGLFGGAIKNSRVSNLFTRTTKEEYSQKKSGLPAANSRGGWREPKAQAVSTAVSRAIASGSAGIKSYTKKLFLLLCIRRRRGRSILCNLNSTGNLILVRKLA